VNGPRQWGPVLANSQGRTLQRVIPVTN
ncbi:uncharacterized protein METZ01_LOCUS115436, partial [marine metagenome]